MRVWVTGGSGFLGRQVVARLRADGHDVLAPRRAELDLERPEQAAAAADRIAAGGPVDVLIHGAAYYGGIGINQAAPAALLARNTQMAVTVWELARRLAIPKVVVVGSACAYPGGLQGDLNEADFWAGPLHPSVEAYGFTKKVHHVAQRAYHAQHGIASSHLILTNLYGPHDVFGAYRSHVVAALIKKFTDATDVVTLWGDGSPVREFLYVKDAAEAIVRALDLPHDLEPINVGTGVGTSIRELAELIGRLTGFEGRIEWDRSQPGGVARKVLDVSRMRRVLDWEPATSLEAGLRQTLAWYLPNKASADART